LMRLSWTIELFHELDNIITFWRRVIIIWFCYLYDIKS
jgi:hypothetical protein